MVLISLATLSACWRFRGAVSGRQRLFRAGPGRRRSRVGVSVGSDRRGSRGLLAGLVLIRHFSPLEIAWGLSLANALAACGFAARARWRGGFLVAAAPLVLIVVRALGHSGEVGCLEPAADVAGIPTGGHRATRCNGNLAVVESEGARSGYENGLRLFTVPDPEAAEEASTSLFFYALLEAPAPRSVLLIGGGLNGSAAEALRQTQGVERLD